MSHLPSTCSYYSKIYGKKWPSMRLGLLSPKKYCAVMNTFANDKNNALEIDMLIEQDAIDVSRYYNKHKKHWEILKAKKKLDSTNPKLSVKDIDLLDGAKGLTDYSSADDLVAMFSDRRVDDDERYFINKASTQLNFDDFVPSTEMKSKEEIITDAGYHEFFNQLMEPDCSFIDQDSLDFDDHLKIYTFPRNSWSSFNQPLQIPIVKLYNYYLMDGASILPVLALDVKSNDICADYCSSPGGKALALLMTLKPKHLQCNDFSIKRLSRLKSTFKQFTPDISYIRSTVRLTNMNAEAMIQPDKFDKILVDVPCSNDRDNIIDFDKNFSMKIFEKKMRLPSVQTRILKSALSSLKLGGNLVYSTCTMSPVENDGVVQKALLELQDSRPELKFAVINLKEAFRPLRGLFKFYTKCKYGQLVVPYICSNFGPMYISKITRIKDDLQNQSLE